MSSAAGVDERNKNYTTLVSAYYELATLFYEWGWGQSFHFAYQLKGESFKEAIARHEYYLAGRLGVKAGDKVLDVGCGIGGPMRNIARFTRANIVGVTLSEYQVIRGNELNTQQGLTGRALSVQANFMKLPFEDNSFDGVYAIEATCHAPVREGVYQEILRVLKPGQYFACYEWCLTPKYDNDNEYHRLIKKKIEEGDGLPDMATEGEVVKALAAVGFEVIEARDMALDETFGGQPWWLHLYPSNNPFSFRFQMSPLGKFLTRSLLWLFEGTLVPSGTYKVQSMLQQGGWGCAEGGYTGAFTPMYLMVARKPLK
jgi:sterol 24-C-methyltransferase